MVDAQPPIADTLSSRQVLVSVQPPHENDTLFDVLVDYYFLRNPNDNDVLHCRNSVSASRVINSRRTGKFLSQNLSSKIISAKVHPYSTGMTFSIARTSSINGALHWTCTTQSNKGWS